MKIHTPRESYLWLKALWDHGRTARGSRERLLGEQLVKFRRLVSLVRTRSAYYRGVMEERGIDPRSCVPTDFPVLTKTEVNRHWDEIVTVPGMRRRDIDAFLARSTDPSELYLGRYHVLHTSGTSGTMGCYVFEHESWIRGASHVVRAAPLKLRRRVAFVAATRGHFAGVSLMLAGNDGTNRLFHEVRPIDASQPLQAIVEQLNEFQPETLAGYARMLEVLAEAQERGELRIRPAHVGNGGEPLSAEAKAYLERIFGVRVMNGYASSEHLYMGMSLPGAEGLHLLEDDLIFELHRDHTCVTNLFNEVLPLIRYRMDDVLVPETSGGSPYPYTRIREIVGRQEDALEFTNEQGQPDFIHPIVIVELVIPGLEAWQIVLESKTAFRFRACYQAQLSKAERAETQRLIREKMNSLLLEKQMSNVRFTVEEVKSLAPDAFSGKFRLVVREEPGHTELVRA